jgi:hypothetical protein
VPQRWSAGSHNYAVRSPNGRDPGSVGTEAPRDPLTGGQRDAATVFYE